MHCISYSPNLCSELFKRISFPVNTVNLDIGKFISSEGKRKTVSSDVLDGEKFHCRLTDGNNIAGQKGATIVCKTRQKYEVKVQLYIIANAQHH